MSLILSIPKKNYEILKLNRGKANPINHDMVSAIRQHIARVQEDDKVRGVILTGNTEGFFSVGLDLKELYEYDETQITQFFENWEAMVMELIKFPKPIIAAINGYSPAGGCVLAVTCDYRMMAKGEKFTIGLNEVMAGIVVPEYIFQMYSFWIGKRQAYQNLLTGKLMKVAEALECKLIDEVHDMPDLLPKAEATMKNLLRIPDNLLQETKKNMRAALVDRLESISSPEENIKMMLEAWFNPQSRAVMKMLLDSLKK